MNYCKPFALLITMLFTWAASGRCQQNDPYFVPQFFPAAPNSTAITKFGDYPVTQFSGVPEISIPLYEVTCGSLKLPITLNYHASGIRVNEYASPAGLGWSINAGGIITRTVKGKADEHGGGYFEGHLRTAGSIKTTNQADLDLLRAVWRGTYDVEPDIFSYNIAGKAGKFFFDGTNNFQPVMVPMSSVKVNRFYDASNVSLAFDLVNDNGDIYSYGKSNTEHSHIVQHGIDFEIPVSWLPEKILSQRKTDSILFSYLTGMHLDESEPSDSWNMSDEVNIVDGSLPPYQVDAGHSNGQNGYAQAEERPIKEITFRNGKVLFEYNTDQRKDFGLWGQANNALFDIKVYGYDPSTNILQVQKTINLYQSYFISGTDSTTRRLRLDSIVIYDDHNIAIQKFRFGYNTAKILPKRKSWSIDYWGYYNGKNNSSLIPRTVVPFHGSNITIGTIWTDGRDPDSLCMKACILNRIDYPTGGRTEFEYEPNQYIDSGIVKLAGGLRVKTIKSYDSLHANPIIKTYVYNIARPNFMKADLLMTAKQNFRKYDSKGLLAPTLVCTKVGTTFLSTPTLPLLAWDAVPVAYSDVSEYDGTPQQNTGYVQYKFTDTADFVYAFTPFYAKPVVNSFFYARGQLLSKTIFKNQNGTYLPVDKIENSYGSFSLKNYLYVGLSVIKTVSTDVRSQIDSDLPVESSPPDMNDIASYAYFSYNINSKDNFLKQSTHTIFDSNDNSKTIVSTTNYYYDNINHLQVSRVKTIDSKGNTYVSNSKYALDYIPDGAQSTGSPVLDTMNNQNIKNAIIETWISVNGPQGITGTPTTSAQLTGYRLLDNTVTLEKHLKLKQNAPLDDFQPAKVVSGQLKCDSRYSQLISMDLFDATHNVIQYTARNAGPVTVLWGYYGQYPIAEVKNAPITDVAYTSFETNEKGNWYYTGSTLSDPTAFTGIRTYSLGSGNISASGLNPSKKYTLSFWSKNGTVSINGVSATAGITKGGWTFYSMQIAPATNTIQLSGTASIDELRLYPQFSLMTTYTYAPGLGITTSCSPSNVVIHYEYDGLGRLQIMRDADKNILKVYNYKYKTN